ncbi:MAG: hypothetical protein ACI8XO_002899 [Verrucomicrobiales bacterium]|jgi:hypothetical protein
MSVPTTVHGRSALTRLSAINTLAFLIPSDNQAFNNRLHEAHETRKAEALDHAPISDPFNGVFKRPTQKANF